MSPTVGRPIPRFVADATREGLPYGRWAERLTEAFRASCDSVQDRPGNPGEPVWFPERAWGGRVYVPVTAPVEGSSSEYFGHVSFVRPEDGEPADLRGAADITDVTAADNPDWKIDLNEDVIGRWQGERDRTGDMTLVWGEPLVPGAIAVTAELDGEVVDQAPIDDGRFTLIALDAVKGFRDDLYLEIALHNQRDQELARDSLYDQPEG
jgi:hypothetical protein